jgi:hypothetical protein
MNSATIQIRHLIEESIYPLFHKEIGCGFQLYFVEGLGYGIAFEDTIESQTILKVDYFCWLCNEILTIGRLGQNYYDPASDLGIFIATKVSQFIKLELITAASYPSLYLILFEACESWVGDLELVRNSFASLVTNLRYEANTFFTIPHELNFSYRSSFEDAIEICVQLCVPQNSLII